MKPITLFGKKINIKIETVKKVEEIEKELTTEELVKKRLIFIALIFIFFAISSKFSYVKNTYHIGTEISKDIIAPNSISYFDNNKKRDLILKLISEEEGVYERNTRVEQEVKFNIENFYEDLKKDKKSKEEIFDLLGVEYNIDNIEKLNLSKEKTLEYLENIFNLGIQNNEEGQNLLNIQLDEIDDIFIKNLLKSFIKANKLYNYEKTEENLRKRIANIDNIEIKIQAGDIVVKKGTVLKAEDIEILKKIGVYSLKDNIQIFIGNILYLIVASIIFVLSTRKILSKELASKQKFYASILAITIYLLSLRFISLKFIHFFPFESLTLMFGILFGVQYAGIFSVFILIYISTMLGFNYLILIVTMISMIYAIYSLKKIRNRTDIINTGIYIGLVKVMIGLSIGLIGKVDFVEQVFKMVELFLSGLLSAMIVIALLPYFEETFNILTKMKLIELGDLSHPLLRKMALEAPGTFHHTMLVATLSELAAEAVGADSTFTRVACYYHDVGKMKRANFYVENQNSGINPHDKLSPTLSTMIIKAHTKDGQEIGKEYKIPKEIRDIMTEHQGTTFLAYFYNKAKKENPDILESDFRYDGPKPRSKESAIIMMADSIEAAVRSLDVKDHVSVEKMIRKIISGKMEDEQFTEADITLKEMEIIINSFVKTLQGIYHSRIKYPDQKK